MEILTIIAIFLGPIIAVQVQKYIESITEKKKRQLDIFRTLMATRAKSLSNEHVQALNLIDLEFSEDDSIINIWKEMLDNYRNYPVYDKEDSDYQRKLDASNEKTVELKANLLYEMAKKLGFNFDKVLLKKGAYIPQAHSDMDDDGYVIRKGVARLLLGIEPLPIKITNDK